VAAVTEKLCSNRCTAGKSATGQSSGRSVSPVQSESGAPLLPKWLRGLFVSQVQPTSVWPREQLSRIALHSRTLSTDRCALSKDKLSAN